MDDRWIHRLVRRELIPHVKREFPSMRYDPTHTKKRLNQGITYIVAKGKNTPPLGFITLLVKDDYLFIDMLAINRSFQGKGLGSALMGQAERYGRDKGCFMSELYVDRRNKGAQRFYAKKGYIQTDYNSDIRCYLFTKAL
jgi:ribosomal protein S18 acetylase RimI-like enzyme